MLSMMKAFQDSRPSNPLFQKFKHAAEQAARISQQMTKDIKVDASIVKSTALEETLTSISIMKMIKNENERNTK